MQNCRINYSTEGLCSQVEFNEKKIKQLTWAFKMILYLIFMFHRVKMPRKCEHHKTAFPWCLSYPQISVLRNLTASTPSASARISFSL